MLRSLKLVGVGPAPEMEMQFASRLNVLTGDNGLGKSLFLEAIWYVLTGFWAAMPAWPRRDANQARIDFETNFENATGTGHINTRAFERSKEKWSDYDGYQWGNFIALYARMDGSIAVYEPARRDHIAFTEPTRREDETIDAPIVFSPQEILDGKEEGEFNICRGLIEDWVTWQERRPETPSGIAFARLCSILAALSPNPEGIEVIRPAPPIRLFVRDAREFPTIDFGYGDTPIIHASAAMLRIISLAYLITWAWREHVETSRLIRRDPVKRIIFLMDEVETHLHPEWQRRILPALLKVLESLGEGMQVQMHVTTHSPMVLASLEPHWDKAKDELFHFALKDGKVTLESEELITRGDATRWLTSHVFGLNWARSVEAERALEDARAFMQDEEPKYFKTPEEVDAQLKHTLPGQDPFWPRWNIYMGDKKS